MENEKVYRMPFEKVYQCLVQKAIRKNRTKEEVDELIYWLLGYDSKMLEQAIESHISYGEFFSNKPYLNPNAALIKGSICGVKIEEISDPFMKEVRYLDKLVDELAKGKAMEKIKR